jgi:ferredoxin
MRIHVDPSVCEGHGECVAAAPELFDLGDDDGAVHVLGEPMNESSLAQARGAERVCPVGAITLVPHGDTQSATTRQSQGSVR